MDRELVIHGKGDHVTLPDARDLHDQVLEVYQVTPDPGGTVVLPGGVPGRLLERIGRGRRVPHSEAVLIRGLGWLDLLAVVLISRDAARRCVRVFGRDGFYGGSADAFRHAYWNARLTRRFGADWTRRLATAHERLPSGDPVAIAMDLHNNEVGRRIAVIRTTVGRRRLADDIEAAVRGGQTVEISADGRLRRSGS
jgi:hypothetical protein